MRARSLAVPAALAMIAGACGNGAIVTFSSQTTATFVVRELDFPTDNKQARDFAIDLDGDGTVDNEFGMVMGALTGMGFGVQASIDTSIAEGRVNTLVRIGETTDPTGLSTLREVQVLFGTDPQPPACDPGETVTCTTDVPPVCTGCQHHLAGNASFTIDPSSPDDAALVGFVVGDQIDAGPGAMSLEFVNGDFPPIRFDLLGAHAVVSLDGSGRILFAGGLSQSQIDSQLVPLVQQVATQLVERDCCGAPTSPQPTCDVHAVPSCGCADNSQGKLVLEVFDVDHDCMVSATEVAANSLFDSLLAPDISIDGQALLSVGVQAFVVDATF